MILTMGVLVVGRRLARGLDPPSGPLRGRRRRRRLGARRRVRRVGPRRGRRSRRRAESSGRRSQGRIEVTRPLGLDRARRRRRRSSARGRRGTQAGRVAEGRREHRRDDESREPRPRRSQIAQIAGAWLSRDYTTGPMRGDLVFTSLFVGVTVAAAVLGAIHLVRIRAHALAAWCWPDARGLARPDGVRRDLDRREDPDADLAGRRPPRLGRGRRDRLASRLRAGRLIWPRRCSPASSPAACSSRTPSSTTTSALAPTARYTSSPR